MESAKEPTLRILVFGYSGQVATELRRSNDPFVEIIALDRAAADLSTPITCAQAIERHAPDAVINAAAYTAVDQAETEEHKAHIINADAPAEMARTCATLQVPFVTLSTDYVFSGHGSEPWTASDSPAPQSAYGRTKHAGEEAVAQVGGTHCILRTSWVFSAHGSNFVKTMLRLGANRDSLSVVADQIGGPTSARSIAQTCVTIAKQLKSDPAKSGIYHYSGAPDVSWAGFARAIFEAAGMDCSVMNIPASDYPTPAKRPHNSRLACDKTAETFAIARPDWRKGLNEILDELIP